MASVSDDELRQLVDRDEIRQLMYKYAHCWDNLDFRGWAECFAQDGVYWEGGGPVFKGREDLVSYAADTGPRVQGRFHLQINQYIAVEGDTAKAHSYLLIVEQLTPVRSGTYDDELVRTEEGWKFAKRTVTCLYPAFLPIAGNDMAAWLFSPEVGGGWQHRSKWRQLQYNLPPAFFQGILRRQMSDPSSALQARQEIVEAIHRYCRSLDRMDRELMSTVFHRSGTVQYPKFEGSWMEFVDWVWGLHKAFESHSHQVTNIMVSVAPDGTAAWSESYVTATLWQSAKGTATVDFADAAEGAGGVRAETPGTQVGVWARYLDRWSFDGRWAIDHRQCVVDFKTEMAATAVLGGGRRDTDDPSYRLLEAAGHALGAGLGA